MKIENAMICDVTVVRQQKDLLFAKVVFSGQYGRCDRGFVLNDSIDIQMLVKLMEYTNTYRIEKLKDKAVRVVIKDNILRGFGAFCKDQFITFGEELKEVTEAQLKGMQQPQ